MLMYDAFLKCTKYFITFSILTANKYGQIKHIQTKTQSKRDPEVKIFENAQVRCS